MRLPAIANLLRCRKPYHVVFFAAPQQIRSRSEFACKSQYVWIQPKGIARAFVHLSLQTLLISQCIQRIENCKNAAHTTNIRETCCLCTINKSVDDKLEKFIREAALKVRERLTNDPSTGKDKDPEKQPDKEDSQQQKQHRLQLSSRRICPTLAVPRTCGTIHGKL